MTPERWRDVERIFGLALDADPAKRDVLVQDACGGDAALLQEVRQLLSADAHSGDVLHAVSAAVEGLLAAGADRAPSEQRGGLEDLGLDVGDVVDGRYRIERLLGAGGMGVVVAANHVALNERVAMKLLKPEVVASARLRERFLREARAAAMVKSEHIVKMRDVGILENGAPYMVMDLLEGVDLSDLLRARGRLPIDEAVALILQATEALADAHGAGIVHRDIKPANLFLERAGPRGVRVKLLDFGVSKQLAPEHETLTGTNDLVGSPAYMSPEQLRAARDVDGRTDIWSLGVVLYELVSGVRPFAGVSLADLTVAVLGSSPAPLPADVGASAELSAVIARCLTKPRDERFADVAELARALAGVVGPAGVSQAERVARRLGDAEVVASDMPSGHAPVHDEVLTEAATVRTADKAAPDSRWRRRLAFGAGAGAILGIGLWVGRQMQLVDETDAASAVPEQAAGEVATVETAATEGEENTAPVPSTSASASASAAASSMAPSAATEKTLPPRPPPSARRDPYGSRN